jgi:hypothetical protein
MHLFAQLTLTFILGLIAGAGIGYKYGSRAIAKTKTDLASLESDLRMYIDVRVQNMAERVKAIAGKL